MKYSIELIINKSRDEVWKMIETITNRNEPEEFSGSYEMQGTRNLIKNRFSDLGENKNEIETGFRV